MKATTNVTVTLSQPATTLKGVVRVVNPCPTSTQNVTGSQDELLPTLGAVQQYMKPELGPSPGTRLESQDRANPSSKFGSAGMVGLNGVWVVFLQAVGDDATLAAHAAALTALVPKPDRTIVCRVAISEARYRQIAETLASRYHAVGSRNELVYGFDRTSDGRVLVRLSPSAEEIAKALTSEFADDIAVTLGHLSWPSKTLPDGKVPYLCLPAPNNSNGSLRVRLPARVSLKQGVVGKIWATAKNAAAVPDETPRFISIITRVGSRTPVAADATSNRETSPNPRAPVPFPPRTGRRRWPRTSGKTNTG